MWITFLKKITIIIKKIWKVLKVAVSLMCQRKRQALDENSEEIKGRLPFIFYVDNFFKKNLDGMKTRRIFVVSKRRTGAR